MQLFIALLLISITLLMLYLKYLQTYWHRRGILHDKPHFLLGNMKGFRKTKNLMDFFIDAYRKYKGTGPFCGIYFMMQPFLVALELDLIKDVLIRDFNKFDSRGFYNNERDDPLTGNLFQLDGPQWRPLRQKLTPTFTSGKMKFMFPTMVKVGAQLVEVLNQEADLTEGGVLELTNLLSRFTADIIGSCAFGLDCNSLANPNAEFVTMGKRILTERRHNKLVDTFMEVFPNLARKLRLRQIPQEIHDFYMGITRNTVKYRQKHQIKRNDFMNLLIEMKNAGEISLNEIAAQWFIFFLAGLETSSTTMGFALYQLAKHQDIQNKLRQEVNEIFKRHNNEFSYECMKDMPYMQQVIAETLRMHPVLPQLLRKSNARYECSDPKYYIEKGTTVVISVYALHFDADLYPEPEKFDPERFTEAEIKKRPSCAYLPFGDGPRNCIGIRFGKMQVWIGLAYLIKNFKFTPCERTPTTMKYKLPNILLAAEDDIYLRVEKVL